MSTHPDTPLSSSLSLREPLQTKLCPGIVWRGLAGSEPVPCQGMCWQLKSRDDHDKCSGPRWGSAGFTSTGSTSCKQHFHGKRTRPRTHREKNVFAASVSGNSPGLFSLRLTFACLRKTMLLGLCRRDVVVVGQPDPQKTVPFWVGFSHLFFPALNLISLGRS